LLSIDAGTGSSCASATLRLKYYTSLALSYRRW